MTDDSTDVTPYHVGSDFGDETDYDRLVEKFGTQPLTEELLDRFRSVAGVDELHHFFRRNIVYTHRDFDTFLDQVESDTTVYLYTGRSPSGDLHMGHILPFELTRYLQETLDVEVVIQLPDEEKFLMKDIPFEETRRYGYRNLKDILAMGFDPDSTEVFFNTEYAKTLYPLATKVANRITFSQVRATMGFDESTNIGSIFYTAMQSAPAFLKAEQSGEDAHCMVPLAIDQDPHLRLTRDVAPKLDFQKPSILHMKFMPSLQGKGKMSSSKEHTFISLRDSVEEAKAKIDRAKTGGRVTAEEQRKHGGEPDEDMVFQLLAYVLIEDDARLARIRDEYASGEMLSGELKQLAKAELESFLTDHQRRREEVEDRIDEFLVSD